MRPLAYSVVAALLGFASLGCEALVDFDGLSGEESSKAACPPGARFCARFEDGTKGDFDDYDGNPDGQNDVIADPGPFGREGNHVMQLSLPDGDLTKVVPAASSRRLHARWYAKWVRGVGMRAGVYAGGQDVVGIDNERPDGADQSWFAALVRARMTFDEVVLGGQYVGMYQNCGGSGACPPDIFPCTEDEGEAVCTNPAHRETGPLPELVDNHWYCMEVAVDAGQPLGSAEGANGSMDYGVDGKHVGPFGGLWIRSSSSLVPNVLWFTLSSGTDGPAILLDDIVISEDPIGCP